MKSIFRILFASIILLSSPISAQAQFVDAPKREYRAVWLTTIKGLDWPREDHKGDYDAQRAHLSTILDSLQAININTILLQTRIRGDVIYPSEIEPFASVFSGKHGVAPNYDPLAYAIEECHKRGMQLHAWLVTIPLGDAAYVQEHGKHSLPARKRNQCTRFKGAWYMEPSHSGTIQHLCALVEEIVSHYDIDGIHFDYIRYPEGLSLVSTAFKTSPQSGKLRGTAAIAAARRDNITRLMRTLYAEVKSIKPWVCVSAATLGKYDDTSRYSSYGWNAYHTVHQEAQKWMREGIVDALFPMLYYAGQHFYPFITDWHEHSYGRHIIAGMGTYQLHPDEKDWELEEIIRQLHVVRAHPEGGAAQFRSKFITDNTKGVYDYLSTFYPTPALVPAMPWLKDTLPQTPQNLVVIMDKQTTTLTWNCNNDTYLYNIYSSDTYPIDISDPVNLTKTYYRNTHYQEHTHSIYKPRHYAVTSIDRYGNESAPIQWKSQGKEVQMKVKNIN